MSSPLAELIRQRGEPRPIKHGSFSGYNYRKCRCDVCREFWRAYNQTEKRMQMRNARDRRQYWRAKEVQ